MVVEPSKELLNDKSLVKPEIIVPSELISNSLPKYPSS